MRSGERMRAVTTAACGLGITALALALALTLVGCTGSPASTPSSTPSNRSASATPTPSATPGLVYTGTARQNLPYFDVVNQRLIAAGGGLQGRDFVDALVKAGFPKSDMEVTADTTSVGLAADNIQFSVKFGDSCLIGQHGNIGYASTVQPLLSTGTCLVGNTVPVG